MREVAFFEAENTLSGLLDQVANGEEFLITRHGNPVARLAPITPTFDRAKARQAANALLEASRGLSLGDCPSKNWSTRGVHELHCR